MWFSHPCRTIILFIWFQVREPVLHQSLSVLPMVALLLTVYQLHGSVTIAIGQIVLVERMSLIVISLSARLEPSTVLERIFVPFWPGGATEIMIAFQGRTKQTVVHKALKTSVQTQSSWWVTLQATHFNSNTIPDCSLLIMVKWKLKRVVTE